MHEFKHVLDHTTKQFLYLDRPFLSADDQAERVVDYFAACLLMPKRVVKSLWCSGHQDVTALAAKLQVSVPALRYRLNYLGLTEAGERCRYKPQLIPTMARPRARYFRAASAPVALEAL